MLGVLIALVAAALSLLKPRAALQLENLALRHQPGVLHRSVKKPKLTPLDRLLWAWLCGVWADWRSALIVVKPETVIAWHRKGFRLFWTWKVRDGQPGRPSVPKDVRDLIRLMSRANPTWGAPRIHGELLKLGMNIGETSVSKYMDRPTTPRCLPLGHRATLSSTGSRPHLRRRLQQAGSGFGHPGSAVGATVTLATSLR